MTVSGEGAPRPSIECERHHTSLRVPDIPAAVEYYTSRLGFLHRFSWGEPPEIAGVDLGDAQIFLEAGEPAPAGCSVYFVVGNADELCAYHRANGVEVLVEPGDRPYGMRDYRVRDAYGYHLGFGHYIYTGGEPIVVERVDLGVRVEKRMAALLHDLAEYKHMSLTSCLEEILLHTCEPLGDGVASPHTKSQLRHIQTLKRRHGIDYDSHGSYRFVERGVASDEERPT